MQLRFVENPPVTGFASSAWWAIKAAEEIAPNGRRGPRVRCRRTRAREQLAIDDLGDEMVRNGDQVVVGGAARRGTHLHAGLSMARATLTPTSHRDRVVSGETACCGWRHHPRRCTRDRMDPSELNVSRVFDAFTGYQRTAALRAAIDLDLFTAVGSGDNTLPAIAKRCGAAERGVRALANRLVVDGFLTKDGERYGLPAESAVFLDRSSPAYIGTMMRFLTAPMI